MSRINSKMINRLKAFTALQEKIELWRQRQRWSRFRQVGAECWLACPACGGLLTVKLAAKSGRVSGYCAVAGCIEFGDRPQKKARPSALEALGGLWSVAGTVSPARRRSAQAGAGRSSGT